MNQSIFDYVKERITARDAAELYGCTVSRNGVLSCPFHTDRHPSAKADERFHCFSCGFDGDAVDFTAKMFGLKTFEAAQKLAADYGLSLPAGTEIPRSTKPAGQVITGDELFRADISRMYDVYCHYFRVVNRWLVENKELPINTELRPYYIEVVKIRDKLEDILDMLQGEDNERKAQFFIEKGGEVNNLERRVKEFEAGNNGGVFEEGG